MLACCTGPVTEKPAVPRRIVSLAPAITEILFAVGAGENVAGVTNYCNHPEEAGKLEKIGDFAVVDFEKVIALKPDLVIATKDGNPREVIEKIRSLGINTLVINSRKFSDVLESVTSIGNAAGRREQARELSSELKSRWETAGRRRGNGPGPSVLLLYGIDPLVAAGRDSLGDELIAAAGGRNIFADSDRAYVTTDYEKIISLAPEVIIQVAMGSESNEQAREKWSRWSARPAVRNGRVCVLDPDIVTRPGPRIVDGLELIGKALSGK